MEDTLDAFELPADQHRRADAAFDQYLFPQVRQALTAEELRERDRIEKDSV